MNSVELDIEKKKIKSPIKKVIIVAHDDSKEVFIIMDGFHFHFIIFCFKLRSLSFKITIAKKQFCSLKEKWLLSNIATADSHEPPIKF